MADLVGISLGSYMSYENDEEKRDTIKYKFIVDHMQNVDVEELNTNKVLLDSMMFHMIQPSANAKILTDEYRFTHGEIPWGAIGFIRGMNLKHSWNDKRRIFLQNESITFGRRIFLCKGKRKDKYSKSKKYGWFFAALSNGKEVIISRKYVPSLKKNTGRERMMSIKENGKFMLQYFFVFLPLYGFLGTIPAWILYSKKELSTRQIVVRKILQVIMLELILILVIYGGENMCKDGEGCDEGA